MTGNILARQWHPRLGTSTDEAIRILILIVALEVEDTGLALLDTLFASDLVEKASYRNQILLSRMFHLRPPIAE